jgi:transposase
MDMIAIYNDLGSYRATAAVLGVDPKTVKRAVTGEQLTRSPEGVARRHNYDAVAEIVAARVAKTSARISAKRLLPEARAAGYDGSARNFRRLVATAKRDYRAEHRRGRRPAVWSPGETLVIDWGVEAGLHIFCAVLAWSRYRFVRFAADERQETTLRLLAECFEELGGVPKVVLADRMGCLRAAVVADVVVPTPDYVRFATHFGFRPDFCQGYDPASKGIVENLVGYAKSDLVVPTEPERSHLYEANDAARLWCAEVNAVLHSEICAVPAERLGRERELIGPLPSLRPRIGKVTRRKVDRLSCVRIGSARYSVPTGFIGKDVELVVLDGQVRVVDPLTGEIVACHDVVAPGEVSVNDAHYESSRPDRPRRAPRAKSATEKAFLAFGEVAEAYLKGAAASGVTRLGQELEELLGLEAAHGRTAFVAALERAVAFSRFRAADLRSILAAGTAAPRPTEAGEALVIALPGVPTRPLSDYAIEERA